MAHTLNISLVRGLGAGARSVEDVVKAMDEYGVAPTESIGVLKASCTPRAVLASLIRRTTKTISKVNVETGDPEVSAVAHEDLYPFGLFWGEAGRLELYGGGSQAVGCVVGFLAGDLGLKISVDPIEVDLMGAVDKLAPLRKFYIRQATTASYAANSYMIGNYSPKFIDTDTGRDFIEQYAEALSKVTVRWAGQAGHVTATLTPQAAFGYSCHDDDQIATQQILRGLVMAS